MKLNLRYAFEIVNTSLRAIPQTSNEGLRLIRTPDSKLPKHIQYPEDQCSIAQTSWESGKKTALTHLIQAVFLA